MERNRLVPYIRKSLHDAEINRRLAKASYANDDSPTAAEIFEHLVEVDEHIAKDLSEPGPIIPNSPDDQTKKINERGFKNEELKFLPGYIVLLHPHDVCMSHIFHTHQQLHQVFLWLYLLPFLLDKDHLFLQGIDCRR